MVGNRRHFSQKQYALSLCKHSLTILGYQLAAEIVGAEYVASQQFGKLIRGCHLSLTMANEHACVLLSPPVSQPLPESLEGIWWHAWDVRQCGFTLDTFMTYGHKAPLVINSRGWLMKLNNTSHQQNTYLLHEQDAPPLHVSVSLLQQPWRTWGLVSSSEAEKSVMRSSKQPSPLPQMNTSLLD